MFIPEKVIENFCFAQMRHHVIYGIRKKKKKERQNEVIKRPFLFSCLFYLISEEKQLGILYNILIGTICKKTAHLTSTFSATKYSQLGSELKRLMQMVNTDSLERRNYMRLF